MLCARLLCDIYKAYDYLPLIVLICGHVHNLCEMHCSIIIPNMLCICTWYHLTCSHLLCMYVCTLCAYI